MTACVWSAFLWVSAIAILTVNTNGAPLGKIQPNDSTEAPKTFSAREAFEKIHCGALEILPSSARLDMLDYWDVDSIYKVTNAMNGLSWLEKVTPDYLKVRISPVSTLEFKLLNSKKQQLVMTLYTIGDEIQAQDSQVKFYNEELVELPTSDYFEMPKVKDFFEIPKGSVTKMKEIEAMIPFPTVCITAFPDNDNLQARLTVEQYINQDDWNIAKLFVKPYIMLEWKKDKYKLAK